CASWSSSTPAPNRAPHGPRETAVAGPSSLLDLPPRAARHSALARRVPQLRLPGGQSVTTSTASSAYPFDLTDLLPRARALAETLGGTPSRNRLMKELKIGAPKATALREALDETDEPPAPAL